MNGSSRGRFETVLTVLALAAVGATIWVLISQNRQLKAEIAELRRTPMSSGVAVGVALAPFAATDLSGAASGLDVLSDAATVLAFTTTTCSFCEETLPKWHELARLAHSRGKRFILVSLDGVDATKNWIVRKSIDLEVWVAGDAVPVSQVPTTLVVRHSVVQRVWVGTLRDRDIDREVLSALDPAGADPE